VIRFTFGSRGIAAYRYHIAIEDFGADHPATRAALGRLLFYQQSIPQLDSVTPEAIAWRRESGAAPGFCNRSHGRRAAHAR
jgi:hypothetical protein